MKIISQSIKTNPTFSVEADACIRGQDFALLVVEFESGDESKLPTDEEIIELRAVSADELNVNPFYVGGYPLDCVANADMVKSRFYHYGMYGNFHEYREAADSDGKQAYMIHSNHVSPGQEGAACITQNGDGKYDSIIGVYSGTSQINGMENHPANSYYITCIITEDVYENFIEKGVSDLVDEYE